MRITSRATMYLYKECCSQRAKEQEGKIVGKKQMSNSFFYRYYCERKGNDDIDFLCKMRLFQNDPYDSLREREKYIQTFSLDKC